MGHFTVMYGTEAGVDLVLIQTFLLYHVNQVILLLTSIFQGQFRGHRQPYIHSKARVLSAQLQNGLFLKFLHHYHVQRYPCVSTSPARTFERKASCLALLCGKIKHKQA